MPHAAGRHRFGTGMAVRQRLDPATVASAGRWADMALMLRTYAEDPTAKVQRFAPAVSASPAMASSVQIPVHSAENDRGKRRKS
ncbi:hypothetical protein [Mesorhizobium sp.]|uniref:hypothetical protein n=1 Tax=Mesorhizobium sp. TaxID=1871066 RepID=UPI000FE870AB|nr:hypothetical protein [Mesorhizobium sp.]RWK54993.1 MAG: hypothetical protein EOR48_14300 [Mesorhizobium sp.]TIP47693.1 MAG: hypothetical protein E5X62_04575 [Mesorhizobium sp.]